MPDPNQYVTITSDAFTQVRALDGTLLGAIPALDPERIQEHVSDTNGVAFAIGYTAQLCVMCARDQDPSKLPGFIPLDARNADLAMPLPGGHGVGGDDPDLAEGV